MYALFLAFMYGYDSENNIEIAADMMQLQWNIHGNFFTDRRVYGAGKPSR